MAQDGNPAQPRSMTPMAGPIDTRVNHTKVNTNSKPIEWFEQNLIASVPVRHPGAFRRVYPGFVQLAAFTAMSSETGPAEAAAYAAVRHQQGARLRPRRNKRGRLMRVSS
jgi:poly-beta-hydroxyalkanoate depolymerase